MKMAILNLSRASQLQVTKTVIKGIQNQRNLVTVASCQRLVENKICKFKTFDNKCPALVRPTKKCLFMGT